MSESGNRMKHLKLPYAKMERETIKAYGFNLGGEMVWIPKQEIEGWSVGEDGFAYFWMPLWLIKKKDLECNIDTGQEPTLFPMHGQPKT